MGLKRNIKQIQQLTQLNIGREMQQDKLLVILKIVVMVLFFLIVGFFGTLPIRSKNFKKRPLLRAIGATFAGCLFLNVAILHILPEAADTLEQYLQGDHHDHDHHEEVFPLAYLFLMVGFIITVFFTKVLSFHSHEEDHQQQTYTEDQTSEDTDTSPRKNMRNRINDVEQENAQKNVIKMTKSSEDLKQSLLTEQQNQRQNAQINKSKSLQTQRIPKKAKVKKLRSKPHTRDHDHDHGHHHDHGHSHEHHNHNHQQGQDHTDGNQNIKAIQDHHHTLQNKSMLNEAIILTTAIYFHTIFEGIAIGVQNSVTGFLSTAIAIGFHKWADALSMGCHYRNKNLSKKLSYSLIIIQAFLNVFSIGLGWIISSSGEVVQAIFLSISAGTFLAISTLQMLGEQFHHKQYMVIKFFLLIGATAFISSVWFLENSIFH